MPEQVRGSEEERIRRHAIAEAGWASGRAVLDKDYEAVLDGGLANYAPQIPPNASEDEILAEAVRITRRH